ncbi:hypothetical protein ACHAWF_004054 [Thalassiosira exigua]
MYDAKRRWWKSLPDEDECPITLEPLSALPYPPFVLTDDDDGGGGGPDGSGERGGGGVGNGNGNGNGGGLSYLFDGLALATYVVSRGTFANPLTRAPLSYGTCVRLDEYLSEHGGHFSTSVTSVREAWRLRDSIKAKVDDSGGDEGANRRRAEALRSEAAVALRGLFVFGHSDGSGGNGFGSNVGRETGAGDQALDSQTLSAPHGFNLYQTPRSGSHCPWGVGSSSVQDGLIIVDDDEAAFEAADAAAMQSVQGEFPCLEGNTPQHPSSSSSEGSPSDILKFVRKTADMTVKEEKQEADRLLRQRQLYFVQALERKRNRILARNKARDEAAMDLLRERDAKDKLQSAREEIERWRARQWEHWEHVADIFDTTTAVGDQFQETETVLHAEESTPDEQQSIPESEVPDAEERASRAAAKKKAKRQKAKERAKEKKRLERLEAEKAKRAAALREERERSSVRCGACGGGVLGCGFEKYGATFCSTKCARNGPSKEH